MGHRSSLQSEKQGGVVTLPPEVQKHAELFLDWLIHIEEKQYASTVLPFSQHAEKLKLTGIQIYQKQFHRLQHAKELLKASFELEEEQSPHAFQEASWDVWSNGSMQMNKQLKAPDFVSSLIVPLQEQMSLPWAWMDRAFNTAHQLLSEKRYEDAQDIYFFLHHLHPGVFEYWLGEATCQHMVGQFQEAADTYSMSLLFQPENPLVFFQIADCLLQSNEKEHGLKALEFCIDLARKDRAATALLEEAIQLKNTLKLQK